MRDQTFQTYEIVVVVTMSLIMGCEGMKWSTAYQFIFRGPPNTEVK